MVLAAIPAPVKDFIPYIAKHPDTSIHELLEPYNKYEAKLRGVFAQSREDAAVQDPHVNVIPLYAGHEEHLKVRARDVDDGIKNSKYIVPLKARKATGSPALAPTFTAFKKNFNLFSESALSDLNWDNIVVAGSAVVNCLLPVSVEHGESTRALRNYYHEELAPSSDVDLFIYGLTEEQAIEKIKEIEKSVQDAILAETTTIRTKYAVTIASQYPTRHIQIVLRLYKSVSEILTGFDVDSSCFAYDGSQVYGTPRGISAFLTQSNTVDLTRRSPSYENRLFKYANRGFEIYCADLDRDRIDPTIYERAFARVQGLARLLVLERLPKESDRDEYRDQRRRERARPAINQYWRNNRGKLRDNFKDKDPQDVAEWVIEEQDDVSSYHTFTVPYGPRYNAKKIEKLLYTKDLLLNAEWNNKKNRTVNLHRHPCFVGEADFILHDCCTVCPTPRTDEEREVAAEESKKYVSGNLEFIKDDPGRQTIGSFNPLTSEDWTDQAYLGNTESLCHAIVEDDLEYVQKWCAEHSGKLDQRDHTGRTPLQLACQLGAVRMVKTLVDAGARMVARLTDGSTALHIACINGNIDIVRILLEKSEANEELEAEKEDQKNQKTKTQIIAEAEATESYAGTADSNEVLSGMDSDEELNEDDGTDGASMTQGSFVKIKNKDTAVDEEASMEKEDTEPDVYDVNVLSWDAPVSPLHLAIICGHTQVVRLLIEQFGADVLLPVKLVSDYDQSPTGAILTLVLAARNTGNSVELTKTLLDLGASPSQSDLQQFSALHSVALLGNIEAMKIMMEKDLPRARAALNHLIVNVQRYSYGSNTSTPLLTAIRAQDTDVVRELLKAGAEITIPFEKWSSAYVASAALQEYTVPQDKNTIAQKFADVEQPIIAAAHFEAPEVLELLLDAGADINSLNSDGVKLVKAYNNAYNEGKTLLDLVKSKIHQSRAQTRHEHHVPASAPTLLPQHQYLESYKNGTYEHWQIENQYILASSVVQEWDAIRAEKEEGERLQKLNSSLWHKEQEQQALKSKADSKVFERIKERLIKAGAKKFSELHPGLHPQNRQGHHGHGHAQTDMEVVEAKQETISLTIDIDIPGITDEDTKRYIELFEAAWKGDVGTIKKLTTKPDEKGNVLKMVVKDNMGITPLHIAIWRGDYEIANLIIEIAHLQYTPINDTIQKRRYFIRGQGDSEYNDSEDGDGDLEQDFFVSSELIDENFTIDDVAKLANQVGSKTSVMEYMSWSGQFWMFASLPGPRNASLSEKSFTPDHSPWIGGWNNKHTALAFFWDHFIARRGSHSKNIMSFAIDIGDLNLVQRIITWSQVYQPLVEKLSGTKTDPNRLNVASSSYLFRALEKGHSNIASELIASTGSGMPIDSLVNEAGIAKPEATKYYQGLLLRGKHKTEWAKEANKTADTNITEDSLRTSLLLKSISFGNVAAVEWCFSDTPARLYKQWLETKDDPRLRELAKANGGLDKFVMDWLESRQNLAIHLAVTSSKWQSKSSKEVTGAEEVLKYLIRVLPESLETKNSSGNTPLSIAMWAHRIAAAKILIEAGADQATRDYNGSNIVHLALKNHNNDEKSVKVLDQSLEIINKKLIKTLFTERCSLGPTGQTPLAVWLWKLKIVNLNDEGKKTVIDTLKTILKYADREPLTMVDGGGQMPLHTLVKMNQTTLLEYLCTTYPELILVENGMGQTPLELCTSIYISQLIEHSKLSDHFHRHLMPVRDRSYKNPPAQNEACLLLKKALSGVSAKPRVLISAVQAGEVAKRLADAKKKKVANPNYYSYRRRHGQQDIHKDEVEKWLKDNGYINEYQDQQS